jgi:hypothetical protein
MVFEGVSSLTARTAAILAAAAACACATSERLAPSAPPLRRPGRPISSVELKIVEVSTSTSAAEPGLDPSMVVPSDRATLRAEVSSAPDEGASILWRVSPLGPHTGPPAPLLSDHGSVFVFQGASRLATAGSRRPNPPLEYTVVASLSRGPQTLQAPAHLRQSERDVLRQEYLDYQTVFLPGPPQVGPAARVSLNTGNYSLVAEETPGGLARLLDAVQRRVALLLASDVQVTAVGTGGLSPARVVVEPGPVIQRVGRLGNTDPGGDDVCEGPWVKGRCSGRVRAGANGIAETPANNRGASLDLSRLVTSAYRNPQRNRAVGSHALNSFHTRGRALDLDPRALSVAGKTPAQLMCLIEAAGAAVAGVRNAFTEAGAVQHLPCDASAADHVHVQR